MQMTAEPKPVNETVTVSDEKLGELRRRRRLREQSEAQRTQSASQPSARRSVMGSMARAGRSQSRYAGG